MTLVSSCEAIGEDLGEIDDSSSDAEPLFELAATEKEAGQAFADSAKHDIELTAFNTPSGN